MISAAVRVIDSLLALLSDARSFIETIAADALPLTQRPTTIPTARSEALIEEHGIVAVRCIVCHRQRFSEIAVCKRCMSESDPCCGEVCA